MVEESETGQGQVDGSADTVANAGRDGGVKPWLTPAALAETRALYADLQRLGAQDFRMPGMSGRPAHLARFARSLHAHSQPPPGDPRSKALAAWYSGGLPNVLVDHRFAAALAYTDPPDIELPWCWPQTLVQIPEGIFPIPFTSALIDTAPYWSTHPDAGVCSAFLFGPNVGERIPLPEVWARSWCINTAARVLRERQTDLDALGLPFTSWVSWTDEQIWLLHNFFLGVRASLQDSSAIRFSAGSGGARVRQRDWGRSLTTFRVGKTVTLDLRAFVSARWLGEKADRNARLQTQFIVRGHWRRQVCGAGRAERKLLWIAPFWKGPTDAPINFRTHKLGGA